MTRALGFFTLAVSLTILSGTSARAAGWASNPEWANEAPGTPANRRPRSESSYRRNDVTPFSPGSNNVALELGQVFLMGDLGNNYEDALGMQLRYTYGVSDMFGFDTSLGHSSHSEGKYSQTTLVTGLRMNLSYYDKVIPHAIFGLGFYKPSMDITPTSSISPVLFGVHLGTGVDLQISKEMFFGANLTFHDVFGTTKMTAIGPVDVGGTYTAFLVHAGYTF